MLTREWNCSRAPADPRSIDQQAHLCGLVHVAFMSPGTVVATYPEQWSCAFSYNHQGLTGCDLFFPNAAVRKVTSCLPAWRTTLASGTLPSCSQPPGALLWGGAADTLPAQTWGLGMQPSGPDASQSLGHTDPEPLPAGGDSKPREGSVALVAEPGGRPDLRATPSAALEDPAWRLQ